MKQQRQGDVFLRQIPKEKLPKDLQPVEDRILARGETTGHSHRMEGGKVMRSGNGQLYVVVEEPTRLLHEEHGIQEVQEGVYEVVGQREYSPLNERRVSD